MIVLSIALALGCLALATQLGVAIIERRHPATGVTVNVTGGSLRVVENGPLTSAPAVVLIHGASANLESMRQPLGDLLARRHRVILVDRPGHGWSERDSLGSSTPAIQARMIDEALEKLGVTRAIVVGHSWAGALAPALALENPARVAGLVMLAPVTHPWPGGIAWHHTLATTPLIGPLFAHTLALPAGLAMMEMGASAVFLPQQKPPDYVRDTAVALLLRPREFLANAWDMVTLKAAVTAQVPRYGEIAAPAVVISGDADSSVSPDIHARRFVAAVKNARLVILPGVGHLVQNAAPDVVIEAVDSLMAKAGPGGERALAAE